jgi:hypothetical protein
VASLAELVVPGQASGRVNGPFSHRPPSLAEHWRRNSPAQGRWMTFSAPTSWSTNKSGSPINDSPPETEGPGPGSLAIRYPGSFRTKPRRRRASGLAITPIARLPGGCDDVLTYSIDARDPYTGECRYSVLCEDRSWE